MLFRSARGISFVPQDRSLFPDMTVLENLKMGGYTLRDRKKLSERIAAVCAMFPVLAERRAHPARTLSGGQQQMLAIGRALMGRPRLLLLDEPSLGLAPLIVKKVYEVIAELRRTGMTVLVVEQAVHVALGAADRTYVMNTGAIVMQGASAELSGTPGFEDAYFGAAAAGRR